ncbi:hypothetical protein PIB30_000995 [Stylosanthes scabra]|uniref:Uncharacterized protein n=1 Tax=Stylosanthes scabra TaxID=79078 RepID=A0ABU6T3E7_9FABA|nr:hypothetical protein [Stylosanthes scabra]
MQYNNPASMNGIISCKQSLEKDENATSQIDYYYNKSYKEAKLMAAFLKNLIITSADSKKESSASSSRRWIDPFSPPPSEVEALAISKITYDDGGSHFYRQKYLAVYNPMKKFKSDQEKSVKNRIHKWLGVRKSKKQQQHTSNNKSIKSAIAAEIDSKTRVFFRSFKGVY